jgi:hypothetical protein
MLAAPKPTFQEQALRGVDNSLSCPAAPGLRDGLVWEFQIFQAVGAWRRS